jgi:hypothetical protein
VRRILLALLCLPLTAQAAITFVGAGTADVDVNDNAQTPTVHASTLAGDALILVLHRGHDAADGGALTEGFAVTDFTFLELVANAAVTAELSVYCKIAVGSDTVSVTPPDGTDGTGDMMISQVFTFRGTLGSCSGIVHAANERTDEAQNGTLPHPLLTITTDNTLLFVVGSKRLFDWTSAATLTTDSFGWDELTEFSDSTGENASIVADYVVQTTGTSLSTGGFTITGDSNGSTQSIALSLIAASPPSFTVGPTLGDPDITSLPVTFTTDQDSTVEGVACADGAAAPDATEIKADQCDGGGAAVAHFDEATLAGVGDGETFTGLVAATIYDLHFVATDADGDSAVSSIANATTDATGAPTITDVDTDNSVTATQANVVITGTDFGAAQGAGSVTLRQSGNTKTLSVDSWAATSIQVDMSGVGMGVADGLIYGDVTVRVTTNTATTDDQAITVVGPSGTQYDTLSGGIVTLAYDGVGTPNRVFGDPIDLHESGQVGTRNAVGCPVGISDVTINADGSIELDDACTSFDVDFTTNDGSGGSQLYIGTVATYTWAGNPPSLGGIDLPDLVFQADLEIVPLNLSSFFFAGDEVINSYTIQLLAAAVDSTTDVNGAVSGLTTVAVDDASALVDNNGDYIQFGSGDIARLVWANALTNEIGLNQAVTVADNTQVNIRTASPTTVPGLTLDSSTGILTGTPTTEAVSGPVVFRATDADGLNADSR